MSKKAPHKPCPFCASGNTEVRTLLGSSRHYCVWCLTCGCIGPHVEEWDSRKIGTERAINKWNHRKEIK